MIKNLPNEFPLNKLKDFDFGDAEAKTDNLLETQFCFCWTRPIYEFVDGKKNIVIGERGSGKSVLFKSLVEKKMAFKNKSELAYVIVPIEEELQYSSLKDYIEKHIMTYIQDPSTRYRIIWELFILSRIFSSLVNKYGNSLPQNIITANDEMSVIFGYKKEPSRLIEFFKNIKATVGVKLGTSHIGTIEPSVYGAIESKENPTTSDMLKNIDIYSNGLKIQC